MTNKILYIYALSKAAKELGGESIYINNDRLPDCVVLLPDGFHIFVFFCSDENESRKVLWHPYRKERPYMLKDVWDLRQTLKELYESRGKDVPDWVDEAIETRGKTK